MADKKRVIVVAKGTYRGVIIMENGEEFIIYLGTYRYEFNTLPETTQFIDDWHKLKEN